MGQAMSENFAHEAFDVYVWEGASDIASRAERCLAGMDVSLVRADAGTAFPPPRDVTRRAVALVSVSVMGDKRFSGYDWLAAQGMPVIWVAAEARGRDPRFYPPEYSYTLPLTFTVTRAVHPLVAGLPESVSLARLSRIPVTLPTETSFTFTIDWGTRSSTSVK